MDDSPEGNMSTLLIESKKAHHRAELFRHAAALFIITSPGTGDNEDIALIESMAEVLSDEIISIAERKKAQWVNNYTKNNNKYEKS
jgi:hypothetical protein